MRRAAALAFALTAFAAGAAHAQDEGLQPPMPTAPFGVSPTDDERIFYHALLEEFEGRFGGDSSLRWEGEAWVGTDFNRIYFKSEGEVTGGDVEDGQQELLYARPVSAYFDLQAGVRYDLDSRPGRGWAAFGIEGLAPLFFHVAAAGYVSGQGHFAAKLEGSYDLLLTQRLILQPQAELNFYSKDDPTRRTGSGLSGADLGLRLRYEFGRKFAPYIGVVYESKLGHAADFARVDGEHASELRFAIGLRTWF